MDLLTCCLIAAIVVALIYIPKIIASQKEKRKYEDEIYTSRHTDFSEDDEEDDDAKEEETSVPYHINISPTYAGLGKYDTDEIKDDFTQLMYYVFDYNFDTSFREHFMLPLLKKGKDYLMVDSKDYSVLVNAANNVFAFCEPLKSSRSPQAIEKINNAVFSYYYFACDDDEKKQYLTEAREHLNEAYGSGLISQDHYLSYKDILGYLTI